MKSSKLEIKVFEIKGSCPVYQVGDTFYIKDGFTLTAEKELCFHSLSSLMPYYVALSRDVPAVDLGLAKSGNKAYIQCLDPCAYTGGGTVIFQITPVSANI